MASRAGIPNKRTARTAELFAPHIQAAIATIVGIANETKYDSDRLAAAKILLEYGLGKPVQSVEHMGEDGGPIQTLVRVTFVTPDGTSS